MSALLENCRVVQGRGRLGWRRFGVVLLKILGKNGKPPLRVLSGPQFCGQFEWYHGDFFASYFPV